MAKKKDIGWIIKRFPNRYFAGHRRGEACFSDDARKAKVFGRMDSAYDVRAGFEGMLAAVTFVVACESDAALKAEGGGNG